jgi:protoporphyrin/coproporphyrin ferrochelatase
MEARRGIILMNLGSPDSTTVKDIRKYLGEFLMDERVIDVPAFFRFLLVKGIIVPFRSPKSAHAYQSIWTNEGSPLIVFTKQLQSALQQQVAAPVTIAMRYGSFSPTEAYEELMRKAPALEEVLLVPLYPHYAMSSYETAVEHAVKTHKRNKYPFRLQIIKPYYDDDDYITALAESIRPYLQSDFDHVLFSYHGVPERHIYKGDLTRQHCLRVGDCCNVDSEAHKQCYRHQCFKTTRLVAQKLGLDNNKFSNSFQSRLGRDEWLKPYTAQRLQDMPAEGIRKLLVVCPAFISDCLETLEEIAIQGKQSFLAAGGEKFEAIPCLNVHPLWVKAIAKWAQQHAEDDLTMML